MHFASGCSVMWLNKIELHIKRNICQEKVVTRKKRMSSNEPVEINYYFTNIGSLTMLELHLGCLDPIIILYLKIKV